MPNRVQFADAIEPLVQFIEETPPSEIVDRTLEKLRAGVPARTMLTASAMAVARSSDLPPGHHGGPLHPLAGLYAVSKLVARLEGEQSFVPVLQHVALSNKHIHHPAMGPYSLLEFEPLDAGGVEATKEAFLAAVKRGETNKADHCFLWLWKNMAPVEALDLATQRGYPEERHGRSLLHLSRLHLPCARGDGSRPAPRSDAAGGALCHALPCRPGDPGHRCADRTA